MEHFFCRYCGGYFTFRLYKATLSCRFLLNHQDKGSVPCLTAGIVGRVWKGEKSVPQVCRAAGCSPGNAARAGGRLSICGTDSRSCTVVASWFLSHIARALNEWTVWMHRVQVRFMADSVKQIEEPLSAAKLSASPSPCPDSGPAGTRVYDQRFLFSG
jgi:hypothetical protein